jgi:hypothetical protein
MNIRERIDAFAELGEVLRNLLSGRVLQKTQTLSELINIQQFVNPWFTPENVTAAIKFIAGELTAENLFRWTNGYPALGIPSEPLKAGVIMAGNIPLVCFHDFLSVLISGNKLIAKTSSKDAELIVNLSELLCSIEPRFTEMIEFREGYLKDPDVVIATGSNNSSRYFEYYFGKYPNIIRKNRNSISIIDGNETSAELESLGSDIFLYFGLGCRNVSKIFIPRGYDLKFFIPNLDPFESLINHSKYGNNYDYNKAVYLVNREAFLDSGYLLLKEDKGLSSPVAVLYYEYYDSVPALHRVTEALEDNIQCIIGHNHVPFGKAQSPHLWDYADGIDTLEFLSKKNNAGIS